MTFRVRTITPERMQVGLTRNLITKAVVAEGVDIAKDYKETVANWEGDKPTFKPKVSSAGGVARVEVIPSGNAEGVKKWQILDGGAKAHIIRARRVKRLKFNTAGFRPKTKSGTLKTGSGSKAKPPTAYVPQVRHPGIKARNWSKIINDNSSLRFVRRTNEAIREGALKLYG